MAGRDTEFVLSGWGIDDVTTLIATGVVVQTEMRSPV
jgi:hypothetical protein